MLLEAFCMIHYKTKMKMTVVMEFQVMTALSKHAVRAIGKQGSQQDEIIIQL